METAVDTAEPVQSTQPAQLSDSPEESTLPVLEPGEDVYFEGALIVQATRFTRSRQLEVMAAIEMDGKALWLRFEAPMTTKVMRKFFQTVGHDPLRGEPPVAYRNVYRDGDGSDFYMKSLITVEGNFVESQTSEEEGHPTIWVLSNVRLGFC